LDKHQISLKINEVKYDAEIESRLLLAELLRDYLGLTGTHIGCDTSNCGACTVLLDGTAVKSCTVFAVQANECEVTTIEGIAKNGKLDPIQEAMWENHAVQCGFCTPGFVMQLYWYLREEPDPTDEQVRKGISGNLCMCTGYSSIVKAAKAAARRMNGHA
jgi:carbon-monoxide dehydrogenase small subunit